MDGKKRIARLRNAEKWKKLGFGLFFGKMPKKEIKPIVAGFKRKKRNRGEPRTDGKVWDFGQCAWVDPPPGGRFGTAYRMIEALEKKGFKRLGSGHYSTVLGHPKSPDKVIKITRHQDNWIDYVKWAAEKGYAGGFGPRVYSWKKFPSGWSWAVVERMERCVGESYEDVFDSSANSSVGCSSGTDDDYAVIFSLLDFAAGGNTMAKVYAEDLCPGALDYLTELRKAMRAGDVRAANTMVRKDGSLCFTDPCCGESNVTTTRLRSGDFSPLRLELFY